MSFLSLVDWILGEEYHLFYVFNYSFDIKIDIWVELVINQLPKLPHNANYQCFLGEGLAIDVQTIRNGLICRTPPVSWRPRTPLGSGIGVVVSKSNQNYYLFSYFLNQLFIYCQIIFWSTSPSVPLRPKQISFSESSRSMTAHKREDWPIFVDKLSPNIVLSQK